MDKATEMHLVVKLEQYRFHYNMSKLGIIAIVHDRNVYYYVMSTSVSKFNWVYKIKFPSKSTL